MWNGQRGTDNGERWGPTHPSPVGSELSVIRSTFPIPFPVPSYGSALPIPLYPFLVGSFGGTASRDPAL